MTLADVLAGIVFLALNAYAVLGGADFGGGVWALLAHGPRKERQRDLIAHAIGPVWEANHVWLILAIVLLFTGFPAAFARLGIALQRRCCWERRSGQLHPGRWGKREGGRGKGSTPVMWRRG